MQKALALILSIIILVLSAVPCDEHDESMVPQSENIVLSIDHTHGADFCNPFFFCHPGHNAFVNPDNFYLSFTISKILVKSQNPYFIETEFLSPVRNPPKV